MRTFAHFPTDDREHRLIRMYGSDAPTSVPETPDVPAPAPETIEPAATFESPEDLNLAADASVETADVDISGMEAPIDEVDQIMNESEGDISADPNVAQTQINLNAAIDGTADFMESAGKTSADFIRSFGQRSETQAPAPPSESEAPPTTEEDASTGSGETETEGTGTPEGTEEFSDEGSGEGRERPKPEPTGSGETETEGSGTPEGKEEFSDEGSGEGRERPKPEPTGSGETETEGSGTPEGKEEFSDEGSGEGRERPAEPDKGKKNVDNSKETDKSKKETNEKAPAEPKKKEVARESKESPEKSLEKEKDQQRKGREDEKLSDVSSGNPDKWSSINNGKMDGSGKPFLYKEGTKTVNGVQQRVLLAYSPNGGVQVMDVNTHEWKFMNQMSKEEQAAIGGAKGMNVEARDAALAEEKKKDPEGYQKRMDQNARNFSMEEDCLKNIAADPKWLAEHMNDPMWKGNEDVRDALAASLENPDATSDKPGAEPPEGVEDKEKNPKIAELKKLMEEMKKDFEKKFKEMSDLLDKLEGEEGKKKEEGKEDVKEGDKEEDEKDDAVADAQKVLDNPDSTAAQKAEAIKTITDATLDDLDGKSDDKSADTKSDATEPSAKSLDINDVQDIKESPDDKQLRSKLISEVRTDPKKTVEGLTQEKNDAFKKVSDEQTKSIDDQESSITTQEGKVNGIKQQIRDLNQSLGPAKPEEVDGINSKIAALKVDQGVEEGNLAKMEENHTKSVDNLKTLKDNNDKEVKMLGELKTEWEKTAKRTDAKFEEMGEKLLTLKDNVGGKIVQSIGVEHDGSLGLKMTGATNAFEMFLNGMSDIAKYGVIGASVKAAKSILDENEMKKLTVDDNPAPAMKAVNAYVKSLEAKKEAKAK